MRDFTEQELVRREKLKYLKNNDIEPFGSKFNITSNSKEIFKKYDNYDKDKLVEINEKVTVAGRIMTKRIKGKAGFVHLQDKYGQIQIYIKIDNIGELEYSIFENSDLGDIIGIEGIIFRTNMGELSVKASKFTHLVKALKPLPEKYHGLVDVEERFRRRYVDLISNEESRQIAFIRPKIIRIIQNYLDDLGYVEVETPILESILGGATARPFVTHYNVLNQNMYLRIATELNLKRLIVGGMDAVYEIGRLFRNEGMDRSHNPEFTSIELYKAYTDMYDMMDICEEIFKRVIYGIHNKYKIVYKESDLDFSNKFRRIHMVDLIKEYTGIDFYEEKNLEELQKLAKQHNIELEKYYTSGHIINEFFEKYVEDKLIQPTFVYGHPVEISPLAKKSKDPRFTERFELFICGTEYGNAFSELNDPLDQEERFKNQLKERELGNEEANEMDIDYIEALEYGMPPCGGLGIGIDRLVMLVTNSDNIKEVILFPHMRNKKEDI